MSERQNRDQFLISAYGCGDREIGWYWPACTVLIHCELCSLRMPASPCVPLLLLGIICLLRVKPDATGLHAPPCHLFPIILPTRSDLHSFIVFVNSKLVNLLPRHLPVLLYLRNCQQFLFRGSKLAIKIHSGLTFGMYYRVTNQE